MDWAEATYEVDFFKKCWFGDGVLVSKIINTSRTGSGLGHGTFAENPKKCEGENDADGV